MVSVPPLGKFPSGGAICALLGQRDRSRHPLADFLVVREVSACFWDGGQLLALADGFPSGGSYPHLPRTVGQVPAPIGGFPSSESCPCPSGAARSVLTCTDGFSSHGSWPHPPGTAWAGPGAHSLEAIFANTNRHNLSFKVKMILQQR